MSIPLHLRPPQDITALAAREFYVAAEAVCTASVKHEEEVTPAQSFMAITIGMAITLMRLADGFAKEGEASKLEQEMAGVISQHLKTAREAVGDLTQ
jgi:hypothetical protein